MIFLPQPDLDSTKVENLEFLIEGLVDPVHKWSWNQYVRLQITREANKVLGSCGHLSTGFTGNLGTDKQRIPSFLSYRKSSLRLS